MNWFWYSLGGAILYAIAEIIGKYLADEKSDPVILSFFDSAYAAVAAIAIASFTGQFVFPTTPLAVIGLIISALIYAIGCITYYAALKTLDISQFVLFTRMTVILIFTGGIIFFGERFSIEQIVGAVAIVTGAIVISWKKHGFSLNRGVWLALATAVLFGIGALIDKAVIGFYSSSFYTFLLYSLMTLFLIFPVIRSYRLNKSKPKIKTHLLLFAGAVFYAVSAIFYYNSYQSQGYVSLTSVVGQLQIPIVVMYGLIVFREKGLRWQKIAATVFMLTGAYLLRVQ